MNTERALAAQYAPREIEAKWRAFWREHNIFSPRFADDSKDSEDAQEAYCIAIPPPNVTGTLHMGHAFQHTLIDILVRRQRMLGKPTLWQMGTDHAGIATQLLVARRLMAQGRDPHALGREAFLKEVHDWVEESGNIISNQIARMGSSVDWEHQRFTMDEAYHQAVLKVFVQLYREGLIYRGTRLVNWDPQLKTAISDLEVINKEEQGELYTVHYKLVDGSGAIQIATTRPETILADGALAISPGDVRYQHLLGKQVWVPMTERQIPVIEDEYVDPEFGTGCVKITPAHDFNDYQVGQRHPMEVINLFTPDAVMNDNAPPPYRGLDRFEARERIVADLQAAGQLAKKETHTYKRPYGDRSGVVIEPYFTDQWFVATEGMAKQARELVSKGEIHFVPDQWTRVYYNWMDNIQDWCISRQLWWGHRIPAWYDEAGNHYIGESEEEARAHYGLADDLPLTQDEDVLDTWFSSALWTYATLGWPEQTQRLKTFHPTDLLVTGFDIIFFWVARMIMFTQHFTGQIPFRQVYVHGLVRDAEGQKMSKSKGNILDPLHLVDGIELEDLVQSRTSNLLHPEAARKIEQQTRKQFPDGIEAHGADALRMTFCSLASTGRDIRFDLGRLQGYRNFCNKLWNATRFVLLQTDDYRHEGPYQYGLTERWLVSRLQGLEQDADQAMADYRFDWLCNRLYDFVWHNYCDWYVELSKPLLSGAETPEQKRGVQRALLLTLDACLRLLHPVIPFVTEELWEQIKGRIGKGDAECLALQPWPRGDRDRIDNNAEQEFGWIMQLIQSLRSLRGSYNLAPKTRLRVLAFIQDADWRGGLIDKQAGLITNLAGLESIKAITQAPDEPCLLTLVEGAQLLVPMQGLVDAKRERQRLLDEEDRLKREITRLGAKLESAFADRAPAELVAAERAKLEGYNQDLQTTRAGLTLLG